MEIGRPRLYIPKKNNNKTFLSNKETMTLLHKINEDKGLCHSACHKHTVKRQQLDYFLLLLRRYSVG